MVGVTKKECGNRQPWEMCLLSQGRFIPLNTKVKANIAGD